MIPLYPTLLSSIQIRLLVLHIIPLPIMHNLSHAFLSHIVPPIIPSSIQTKCVRVNTQCISHCFTLQPLPATDQWTRAYNDDSHTKVLLNRLYISTPLDKPTIIHLPTAYRTTIARNLLGILEGRLVYYEKVTTVTNNIYRTIVSISLRRIIFNLVHATPITEHMREYKTLYRIKLQFSWARLRSDVSDWIKQCAHCMLAYHWRRRGQ